VSERLGVSNKELKEFVNSNPLIKDWLRKRPQATKRQYGYQITRYFKWLKGVKSLDITPEELINDHIKNQKSESVYERKKHAMLLKEYVFDTPENEELSDKSKSLMITAVRSFYDYCEAPLTTAKGEFKMKTYTKYEYKQFGVNEAKKIIDLAPQREKTIFVMMLQGAFRIGDALTHVNYRWEEIKAQLEAGKDPIKITMYGGEYWTYITTDAIQELKKYIAERGEPEKDEPIFITRSGKPVTVQQVTDTFHRVCQKLGMIKRKRNRAIRYPVNLHMFRKLFKSEASVAGRGIDQRYVEFFMGHAGGLAKIGGIYDKSPELHEDVFEQEYQKIAPHVNIYTGIISFEQRLRKAEEERERLKEQLGLEEFERLRRIGIIREKKKKLKHKTSTNGGFPMNNSKQQIVSEYKLAQYLSAMARRCDRTKSTIFRSA